jgi:hypothetical protein
MVRRLAGLAAAIFLIAMEDGSFKKIYAAWFE